MPRATCVLLLTCALATALAAGDDDVTFRSDVSLVRVDAQVVDSTNRAITHLHAGDFVLREDGRVVPIKSFASDNMPVDVLFLLDVSASMRPHVQRIADASGQALTELGKDDRMGIMVFDRYTRVRLALNSSRQDVQRGFDRLLREERFNGGTDITRAMLDAADYMRSNGRRDARRAIVILTDDQTEFDRDDEGVGRALERANAVMCALIAPDAMQNRGGGQRGGWGNGGGLGGGLGGIIFGQPRGGGNRYPGGGGGSHTHSAGTSEIARDSGGDSMSVNDAEALDDTLARLRQRYTLYFSLPDGVQPGQERNIQVDLTPEMRRRFSDAEVRYRRTSISGGSTGSGASPNSDRNSDSDDRPHITRRSPGSGSGSSASTSTNDSTSSSGNSSDNTDSSTPAVRRRRVAVNEDGTPIASPDQQ
ncbi:MAG: VWA domain-containing protein [Bryobacteraceae bacterium]|jgi:VWFA-related protein